LLSLPDFMSNTMSLPRGGYMSLRELPSPSPLQSGVRTPVCNASAALPPPSLFSEEDQAWEVLSAKPPTVNQLASLTSLPLGLASSMLSKSKTRRRSASAKQSLVREGQIVSRMYDSLGSRPQPNNGLHLEQSIQLEMMGFVPNFLTSSTTSGVQAGASHAFTLADFSGQASLVAVFDQYRIEQIETWLTATSPNAVASFPLLTTAVDLDDANAPTVVNSVEDHLGAITSDGPGGHYHRWKPHIAVAAYSGSFTSYTNIPSQFIDSSSPSVQHYGFKAACYSTGAISITYDLVFRAVVTLRAPVIN
jgi:hypothetical protein